MQFPITCPQLSSLFAFWEALRGNRAMPSRQEVDVAALKPWLGHLTLLAVIDGGRDYYVRVHGTNLREMLGRDLTGRYLKALPDEWVATWVAEYDEVVKTRAPSFTARRPSVTKDFMSIEKLMLPFSTDGNTVDMILYGVYPVGRRRGAEPRLPEPAPIRA
jgi:hypothetical protein